MSEEALMRCADETCDWRGPESECRVHRGHGKREDIGPLCPVCGEFAYPDDWFSAEPPATSEAP